MNKVLFFSLSLFVFASQKPSPSEGKVYSSDIDNFWLAYDLIVQERDSAKQIQLIDSLYINKGSIGLRKMMEVRNYTANEYVALINQYPKFFTSIRPNTLKAQNLAVELNAGIDKLAAIYPELSPAEIYFTIGCMRSNGTTRDRLVLIGSELAMADNQTDISEFEGQTKSWLATFFASNPIENLVLLNVHEYVHTQQKPIPDNLLYIVLYEGIAEFVSVTAMNLPSVAPAVQYGKNNPAVKKKFEKEMFYERIADWLWSSHPNEFGVRDLGYYIGYAIAERYYNSAVDKQKAIKELIELDYEKPVFVNKLIDYTGFFSKSIESLRKEDRVKRPKVINIKEFKNGNQVVDPNTSQITFEFSEQLNGHNTGVDYADIGSAGFPEVSNRFWSNDAFYWTLEVALRPNQTYKFWITSNFRTDKGTPLLPYLVEFKTGD